MARLSTSPAKGSPTPRRCAMRSSGRRGTRRSSRHEPLDRAHARRADAADVHADLRADVQAAGADAANARQAGDDVDHDVKRHWLASASIFTVACAWGATFSLIKDVLRTIAPEPFIAYRFTLA